MYLLHLQKWSIIDSSRIWVFLCLFMDPANPSLRKCKLSTLKDLTSVNFNELLFALFIYFGKWSFWTHIRSDRQKNLYHPRDILFAKEGQGIIHVPTSYSSHPVGRCFFPVSHLAQCFHIFFFLWVISLLRPLSPALRCHQIDAPEHKKTVLHLRKMWGEFCTSDNDSCTGEDQC